MAVTRTIVSSEGTGVFIMTRWATPPAAADRLVELRIGDAKADESPHALMTPSQARIVAYQLLQAAEEIEESRRNPRMN
jgi:hypothetical protein